MLKEHGLEPAAERSKRMPWATFLTAHWGAMAPVDLFTVEAWARGRLARHHVLFELSSRRVHVIGITSQPHADRIKWIARDTSNPISGFLLGTRYLIMDRDAIFTSEFRGFLKHEGVKSVRLAPRSPNLSAYAERFVRAIQEGCLNRMFFIGVDALH